MTTPRTCTQMHLPPDLRAKADMLSVKENPANSHQIATGGIILRRGDALTLAPPVGLKWLNSRVLRVKILGGTDKIKTKVRQYAAVWTEHANITFDFVESGDAEIRVNIDSSGASWSYMGTDNLCVPQTQPTMNLGWLTDASSEAEFSSVIIHQFGHVLGCIHEHQSPTGGISWNKEIVYAHYAATVGWSQEDVDRNVFQVYSSTTTQYSEFDATSIMRFPIAPSLTTNGFSVEWNTQLSEMDQAFIVRAYPRGEEHFYVASFNTMEVRAWDKPAMNANKQILFPTTYGCPPQVAVGLNWLDVSKDANIRVTAFADNISASSADVHINTWSDTTLYSAGCTLFPVPPGDLDFQVGQFSTQEDHPWQNPQLKTTRRFAFAREYASPPNVVVFLNQLDMAKGKNWRVTTTATDVTTTGFTLHIDTWADTVLYSATAAWIAYPLAWSAARTTRRTSGRGTSRSSPTVDAFLSRTARSSEPRRSLLRSTPWILTPPATCG
ncbi:hypothetical protein GSI_02427 [Ganoderma sinense ZZ0214-1]|uniref:Peptidase metallopeptidase domain-containing protein n=1 Tax=Ganoderma sinense ZZ0214-1 TaxID=1077348 RepID=A0A2G8SPJ8_9APHY|nr:hypothetical protein GSI_02427 [Ganoderma sinense ZZ0214-1]